MEISLFKCFTSKKPTPSTLAAVADMMRNDAQLESITTAYRHTGSKSIKTESPLFGVACLFNNGKSKENITRLTGLSLVDFDHIDPHPSNKTPTANIAEMKKKAVADPHTLMCYTTISGNGLRIIYKYDMPHELHGNTDSSRQFYLSAFYAGNTYYGCSGPRPT